MKKISILSLLTLLIASFSSAQLVELDTTGWLHNPPVEVLVSSSPELKTQIVFIGGVDSVETTTGMALAKEWNDFIGFTPITPGVSDSGYVTVNHEMIVPDPQIGDGGGMTVFKVMRSGDSIQVVGGFKNVDFSDVGGTGMNCGGITSVVDGRIWTAEEWWRGDNASLNSDDTADVTLAPLATTPGTNEVYNDIPGTFSGQTIQKYEAWNYMVEVDPANAKAIRKQYNWGRQPFEGGAVFPDNKTVYLCADATPSYLTKFVATTAGDFTSGKTYVFQQGAAGAGGTWIEIPNDNLDSMLVIQDLAAAKGATMFNRLEWGAYNGNKFYFTETGRDTPGSRLKKGADKGGKVAQHHIERAKAQDPSLGTLTDEQIADSIYSGGDFSYKDYYGRVLVFDPATEKVEVFLEAGPEWTDTTSYPEYHLSNPDGLSFIRVNSGAFMIIQEDLNGTSMGRVPHGVSNRTCEVFLLDMSIANPTLNDLMRVAVVPQGAEVTGAVATPDGKTMFINSQHPSSGNPYPYNHSLTLAISGWEDVLTPSVNIDEPVESSTFTVYPNPLSVFTELKFNKITDVALFDSNGRRLKVARNTNHLDISDLSSGIYFIQNVDGEVRKVIVQ